ncbi:MAG: N-6 DNA methylase [Methylocystis sp.]
MTTTSDIVAKLWSLCHVLRDDGVTYNEYVTELTYLLFLKMLEETKRENRLPAGYRWAELVKRDGLDQLDYYKRLLLDLGKPEVKDELVRAIFTDAQTRLRKPTNLKALTTDIDKLDWFSAREEGLGNLYEGLLEKNASDKKSGAGQYFTPRPLIDCIVRLMKPQAGEIVQDPAAGTAGFLVAADHFIKAQTDELYKLPGAQAFFQRHNAFVGAELVPDTHRLCMMNLLLHGIEGGVSNIDTLSPDGETLAKADLILTNPPFGTKKGGGRPTRNDFSVTADNSNKQLAFVEHIVRALKPGGRAAVVVPDNVLFEDNTGRRLRAWLMDLCNLHTVLRLPTGIFYAQGVKTNVLFFQRGKTDKANTKAVWVYDMRANMPAFGKTRPLTIADFADFETAYGDDPNGGSRRKDQGEEGRWRCFSRDVIKSRNDNLDISWLRDTEAEAEEGFFSFPLRYFEVHHLEPDWPAFLDDFQRHWPTNEDHTYVDFIRDGVRGKGAERMGDARWRRLTELRTKRAKSVFHFDVQGSVAKSTHAGIPWLRFIRQRLGPRVHFWPFDGWDIPAGRSAIAEVYPALWSREFDRAERTSDQHDAYSVAAWLSRADRDGSLEAFLKSELSPPERTQAQVEGWILGVA